MDLFIYLGLNFWIPLGLFSFFFTLKFQLLLLLLFVFVSVYYFSDIVVVVVVVGVSTFVVFQIKTVNLYNSLPILTLFFLIFFYYNPFTTTITITTSIYSVLQIQNISHIIFISYHIWALHFFMEICFLSAVVQSIYKLFIIFLVCRYSYLYFCSTYICLSYKQWAFFGIFLSVFFLSIILAC